jgi:hypothetical protein
MWQQRFYQANDQLARVQSPQGNFQSQEALSSTVGKQTIDGKTAKFGKFIEIVI